MKHLLRLGMLAAMVAIPALFAQAAPAKPAAPAASTVGVIDVDTVDKEFKGFEAAQAYWGTFQEERLNVYKELNAGQFLTSAEFEELRIFSQQKVKTNQARHDELIALAKKNEAEFTALMDKVKGNLSEEDQKHMDELQSAPQYTPDAGAELDELIARGVEKLSAEDKARFTEMKGNQEEVSGAIGDIGEKLSTEIEDEKARLIDLLTAQMQTAIEKVAKDNNLSIVLNRNMATQQGSQQLVMWGGTDITTKVIENMNATFKPESLEPPKEK